MYPAVLVFACNWDGWSCSETASNLGLQYPASVKVVRVECLSRVHLGLILKAFEFGADGVMLLGCEPSMCHFSKDNKCVLDEYEKARGILEMLGIHKDRLVLTRLPAFDGRQFVAGIMNLIERIEQMPSSGHSKLDSSHIQGTKIRSHS